MSAFTFTAQRGLALLGTESGAWFADTTEGSVSNGEKILNSEFKLDVTGWSPTGAAALSWSAGELEITALSSFVDKAQQNIISRVVPGKTYLLEYSSRAGTAAAVAGSIDTQDGVYFTFFANNTASFVEQSATITVPVDATALYISAYTIGAGTGYFDYIRFREIIPDLSGNGNNAVAIGTINTIPVAVGSDLVGFGGFVGVGKISNGSFDTDTVWTKGVGWSISSGFGICDGTQISESSIEQPSTLVVGQRYQFSYTLLNVTAGSAGFDVIGSGSVEDSKNNSSGYYAVSFVYQGIGTSVGITADSEFVGWISNVTLTQVNVIEVPYRQGLNPSVGSLSISMWVSINTLAGTSAGYIIDHKSNGDPLSSGFYVYYNAGGNLVLSLRNGGAANTVYSTAALDSTDGWVMITAVVNAAGTQADWYINGALDSSTTMAQAQDITNAAAITVFGSSVSYAEYFDGSISLTRIWSSTSLTAAQIKTLYESEKRLFKQYSYYTQLGVEYSLDIPLRSAVLSTITKKTDNVSLDRTQTESIVDGEDNEWALSTALLHRTDNTEPRIAELRELMYSTRASEPFTIDLYGTVANEDEPKTVIRVGNNVKESREGVNWISAAFKAREL